MEEVTEGENGSKMLSEDHLRDLSRNIKTLVPARSDSEPKDEEINSFQALFEDVFYTSSKSNLPATHRVAAWNFLCGLIDQCLSSESRWSRDYIWRQDLWNRSFELYLSQGNEARPKSAKQLLATLSSALKKAEDRNDLAKRVAECLLSNIHLTIDHGRTKSSLQALAFFIGRDVLPLDAVLRCLSSGINLQAPPVAHSDLKGLLALLFDCCGRDLGATIGQVLTAVLDRTERPDANSKSENFPLWLEPLENAFDGDEVDWDELRTHIFPALFKRSLTDYVHFLDRHGLQRLVGGTRSNDAIDVYSRTGPPNQLLLAGLMSGNELGLLYETPESRISSNEASLFLPIRYIERLLYMSDRSSRLTGLSLLITTRSATRPVPKETFRILKRRLCLFFVDTDANFRGEVFSLIQRLMDRIRAATAAFARQSKTDTAARGALREHEGSLRWLIQFLGWELRPTASYQRHISALKTLLVVVKSGSDDLVAKDYLSKSALNESTWPFSLSIMTLALRVQLLNLLMDPFDDVRRTSATILSIYAASYHESEKDAVRHQLLTTINEAEATMLVTGRADHADGVAHLYQLLFSLANDSPTVSGPTRSLRQAVATHLADGVGRMLSTAKESLVVATNKYPLHGLLTSIRYTMLQDEAAYKFEDIVPRLIEYLHTTWEVVKPVLCNDAPEGYVPEHADDMQSVTTKDTLSYCWRGLKESSLLLGVLVNSKLLDQEQVLALGNLCFVQLAELRHRGAFSTVAQTWAACCVRCKGMQINGVPVLEHWYGEVLSSLRSKTTINTRRSAGLPSLICGILVADKTGHSTSQAVNDLTDIARQPIDVGTAQESSLPQVHALNCIKDILKNTRLAEHTERFVAHAFLLAAESLRSQAWAVRNCGLMLFRAAIDRLLGTSESHLEDTRRGGQKISLSKQPEILDAIFDLLQPETDITLGIVSGSEGVFPALQLVQRVQIPGSKHEEAIRAVEGLLSSRSWHVRDKAARTFATIATQGDVVPELERLLLTKGSGLNGQHGALLCAKYLIARLDRAGELRSMRQPKKKTTIGKENVPSSADGLLDIFVAARDMHFSSACPLIKAAFVDVLLAYCHPLEKRSVFKPVQDSLVDYLSIIDVIPELKRATNNSNFGPGAGYLRRTLAQAFAFQLLFGSNLDSDDVVSTILELGRSDPDACASLFEEVRRLPLPNSGDVLTAVGILIAGSSQVLERELDVGLKCQVQRFLLALDLNERSVLRESKSLQTFLSACNSATRPHGPNSNHIYADHWLQLEAVKLEHLALAGLDASKQSFRDVARFVESCNLAIQQEQTSLFSREAAALAMQRIDALWQYLRAYDAQLLLDSCLVIYDLLNDDDEDIRQIAAQVVSRILTTETTSDQDNAVYEPITAQQRLIRFMLRRWPGKPSLAAEAINRAFEFRMSGQISSVKDRIATCRATDTALFVEEKQNLYIDEAREVKFWTQVVSSLSPTAIPRQLTQHLALWVSAGLQELKSRIETTTSPAWTTKPDAFVIGLQVVYGAEVLLRLVEKGVKIPARPSHLREQLAMLALAGRTSSINGLLMAEIERVVSVNMISSLVLRSRLLYDMTSENR